MGNSFNLYTQRFVPPVLVLVTAVNLGIVLRGHERRRGAGLGDATVRVGSRLSEELVTPVIPVRGQHVQLSWGGQPNVIYWFASTCPWCERNADNAESVFLGTRGRYKFLAVSFDGDQGLLQFVARHHPSYPIYTIADEVRKRWSLGGTPTTVVLGTDGRVRAAWKGAYVPRIASEIGPQLGLRLPGLAPGHTKK